LCFSSDSASDCEVGGDSPNASASDNACYCEFANDVDGDSHAQLI
jgi:hypothetical protein